MGPTSVLSSPHVYVVFCLVSFLADIADKH